MRTISRLLALPCLLAAAAYGQTLIQTSPSPVFLPSYQVQDAFSSSSGETLTIQLPANSPRSVYNGVLTGSTNAAATICFYQNGTAATTTAKAIQGGNGAPFTVAQAFTSSNVGTGSAGPCFTLATGPFAFSWANIILFRNGFSAPLLSGTPWSTVQNFSATITPSTGTISGYLNAGWNEQ